MYSKILVTLDGSKTAERVLPSARYLSERLKVPVEFLSVIEPELTAGEEDQSATFRDALLADRRRIADLYLKNSASALKTSMPIACTVAIGSPAEVIVDSAAKDANTVIAIGTHGRSGIQRWLLGSVADKVLHSARNPLLLIRTAEEKKDYANVELKSIIVPLDGSELAENVLPHAIELAQRLDAELVLLRVFNLPTAGYDEGYVPDQRTWELIRDEAQGYLDARIKEIKGRGFAKVSSILLEGFTAERIIAVAQERPDSLIAICTHGRTGVRRFILGSIADRVVRHSGNPVLLIRAPGAVP